MTLQDFTAEASLYTTGHSQVDRRVINLYRRKINAIEPARAKEEDIVGHEVIEIEDEAPGSLGFPWGWGGGGHGGGQARCAAVRLPAAERGVFAGSG